MSKAVIVDSVRAVQVHFDEVVEDLSPHEALAVMQGCVNFLKGYIEDASEDIEEESSVEEGIEDVPLDWSSTEDE